MHTEELKKNINSNAKSSKNNINNYTFLLTDDQQVYGFAN